MRRRVRVSRVILLASLMLAASCSSSTPAARQGTPSSPGASSPQACPSYGTTQPVKLCGRVYDGGTKDIRNEATVRMTLSDFTFTPTFLHARVGQKVTITLVNPKGPTTEALGYYAHTFTIESMNVNVGVSHGQTKTVTFTVPAEPSIVFICAPHRNLGMQGAIYTT